MTFGYSTAPKTTTDMTATWEIMANFAKTTHKRNRKNMIETKRNSL